MKRIVLCADDYGYSPGVSGGIRELLDRERLSATSCMVVFPEFETDGPLLKPFLGRADIGLHFTLTSERTIGSVAWEAHIHPPPLARIVAELEKQVSTFRNVIGRPPDYIDGHQHVHVLPVVRDAVVQVAKRLGAYVRNTMDPIGAAMCRRPGALESIYLACASRKLSMLAQAAGVPTNHGFRGVRTFREKESFRTLFRRMIRNAGDGCLVMCHPGYADPLLAARDPVQNARADELRYLAGPDFPRDLAEEGVVLSRLVDALRAAA
ncbi:MAG TPA: ChbG/HpnK family deacetylase [Rhizomicrobium sp.]|nr:ChbG/HpnK family deacetylase [Rhizomicrobium sp.]